MEINKIKEKIKNKEQELVNVARNVLLEHKPKAEEEKSITPQNVEWVGIPDTDFEVTKEVLFKGKSYNEILKLKKPDEDFLTLTQVGLICEHPELLKELKMDSSSSNNDFVFKQPFPQNEKKGYVALFCSGSGYAYLYCGRGSDDSYSGTGVRFVRKKYSSKK